MMKANLKLWMLSALMLISLQGILAQSIPTLEMPFVTNVTNLGVGASTNPVVVEFKNDNANSNVFSTYTPTSTLSVSFANQQFTGLSYGTANYQGTGYSTLQSTGLVFGIAPTLASDPLPQGGYPYDRYNKIGVYGGAGGPNNGMFTSNPTAVAGQFGTGINVILGSNSAINGGVEVFTTAQALFNDTITYPRGSRAYFGNLVLRFSQPVKNPVIHVAGLGGFYSFLKPGGVTTNPADYISTYFTTELELINTGLTSNLLSGNPLIALQGNNIINTNHVNPNGGSVVDPSEAPFNNYGAASGSIKITGIVQELVYRVYLQGGSASQFAWSIPGAQILQPRDPFTGDIWYVAASYDKPTQQVFGNVFIDPQTSDNNINESYGGPNARTNVGGLLYANLISGGLVIASVPVSVNGDYLFDAVPTGTYTVQLSVNQGVAGQAPPATALPPNWVNTGEFIGSGAGTDGAANGISAPFNIAISNVLTNVNFGIKAANCPNNVLYTNPPALTGYFGGFELNPGSTNFYPTGVNFSNGRGRIYQVAPLAAANYSITTNPNLFSNTLSSYPALGGQNQMVVKPSATNQTAYYLVDSAGKTNSGFQITFIAGPGPGGPYNFRGWFSKATGADAVIKIKIYDADDPTKVFQDMNVTLTGGAGSWVNWSAPWFVNYGAYGQFSLTKKVRFDIISVNGAPFSIDELCFEEPALGPPLPIILSDFTVNKSDCNANLVWKTSSESNSDRFEVEVSTSANPAYTAAGTVLASGTSSTAKTYQYSYPMQPGIVYYFRIKMIDKDGSFIYSDTRSSSCTKGKSGIVIAPNPVKTSFTITGMENGKNSILVYAANGQLVKTQMIAQNQGSVIVANLTPGMYTVKITSETGNTVVEKLIKY